MWTLLLLHVTTSWLNNRAAASELRPACNKHNYRMCIRDPSPKTIKNVSMRHDVALGRMFLNYLKHKHRVVYFYSATHTQRPVHKKWINPLLKIVPTLILLLAELFLFLWTNMQLITHHFTDIQTQTPSSVLSLTYTHIQQCYTREGRRSGFNWVCILQCVQPL